MPYAKTALAAEALRHRSGGLLAQRQRAALILFDGQRSVDEVLRHTAGLGVQPEDIAHLLDNGLLQDNAPEPVQSQPLSVKEDPHPGFANPPEGMRKLGSGPAFPHEAPNPGFARPPEGVRKLGSGPAFPHEPATLTNDEQQQRYRRAYPLATQITATLGLRGFKLNLAVERAEGYAGLRELLPKIEAAAGTERAAALRHALDGIAR